MKENSKKMMVTAAIVGLLIGGGAGYALHKTDPKDETVAMSKELKTTDTKAAGLRVLLNNLEA